MAARTLRLWLHSPTTVRPHFCQRFLRIFRGFGKLPNKQNPRQARLEWQGFYGSGYPLPMLAKKVFYLLYPYFPLRRKSHFAELIQKKNVVILKRLQRFLKSIFNFNGRSHLSSFSTSLISFAVAVTIRIPLSLIVSSNVSSCRRCVFFVSGFSKRNWSTDIS